MEIWAKKAAAAFLESEVTRIKENVMAFAAKITKAILSNRTEELEDYINASIDVRDEVEFHGPIARNREFYFGYWYAHENLSRRLVEYNDTNKSIDYGIKNNDKLRKLIRYLDKAGAARQKDVAEHLQMKPNEFANFMNTDIVKQSDLINKDKIGRNVIYSLNAKARKYIEAQLSVEEKNYSKADIIQMLEYIRDNRSIEWVGFEEESPLLDHDIIKSFFSLFINEGLLCSANVKKGVYLNKRNNKAARSNSNDRSHKGYIPRKEVRGNFNVS